MLILMSTSSSDEHINENYDYAIVKIEDSEARRLAEIIKHYESAKQTDATLMLMTYSAVDIECEFYTFSDDPENDIKRFPDGAQKVLNDGSGYFVLPDDFVVPEISLDPQYLLAIVGEDGFWWQAFPGASYITIDTATLPKHLLSQIL
jgi:hypothetical protein